MKKVVIGFIAISILIILGVNPLCAADDPNQPERFLLFNAEYNSALIQTSKTTGFGEKKLFKLDTKTGETWMLIDVLKEGRNIIYWKKIGDVPSH